MNRLRYSQNVDSQKNIKNRSYLSRKRLNLNSIDVVHVLKNEKALNEFFNHLLSEFAS